MTHPLLQKKLTQVPPQKNINVVDMIAQDLLTIEESAKMEIGCTTNSDQCLHELNFPGVSELTQICR